MTDNVKLDVQKDVEKFSEAAIKFFDVDLGDSKIVNRQGDIMGKIARKYVFSEYEDQFYNMLFSSQNPCVLYKAADFSMNYNYDLVKSREVIKQLIAMPNLRFSKYEDTNQAWIKGLPSFIKLLNKDKKEQKKLGNNTLYRKINLYYLGGSGFTFC